MDRADILREMRYEAGDVSAPIMREESVALLTEEVERLKPKRILEIGTAIGYSGTQMLFNAGEDTRLTTIELDVFFAELALKNFEKSGLRERVRLIEGDAGEVVAMMEGRFDFILLDGPKGQYEHYRPYLKRLLNVGGILFADNVLFKGYVNDYYIKHKHRTIVNSLTLFIRNMQKDPDFETRLLETEDGIIIAKLKVES
ncbi:MAG: O-methyltransferase [Clostridiales bacterium]|jgi:predicted O-methyltransferase YrrM|nr:O-methyltransferase [Clostridiales bacterium]